MILALIIAQFFVTTSFAEDFTIHRVESQHNQAVLATVKANEFHVGDEFAIETPQGRCHANVTQIITDYIYINTEQCQSEYVQRGTPVYSTKKVVVERAPAAVDLPVVTENSDVESVSTGPEFMQSEFYQSYIKEHLSANVSYLSGTSLDGRAQLASNTFSENWRGSNTLGFGADYAFLKLPYNMSLSAGLSYNLPRSYGRFKLINNGNAQNVNFSASPKIEVLSLYSNVRYHFNEKLMAYFGLNHLFVSDSNLPGEMNGDFGFHAGARYYMYQQFYAEGSLNFYNMNYVLGGKTADFSMTELELKAGYTF